MDSTHQVDAIGVYKWPYTRSDVRAFSMDAWGDCSAEHMRLSEEQLAGLVLIEILVKRWPGRFDAGQIAQAPSRDHKSNTQVPYDESFWTPDGSTCIKGSEPPTTLPFRVVFFLHYYEPANPLWLPNDASVPMPPVSKLPNRISVVIKEYIRP